MQRNQVEEFYRELDATREDFVREKFLMNKYAGWKVTLLRGRLTSRVRRESHAGVAHHRQRM